MNLSARDLYNRILDYKGENILNELLIDWVEDNDYRYYLTQSSTQLSNNINEIPIEISWELYAFSRVLDILTLGFQPNNNADNSNWLGPKISVSDYVSFAEFLGLKVINKNYYHPFYWEIFEAIEGESDFQIAETYFPPLMLDNLLIKRGGVEITLNLNNYDLDLVNNSTIFWTYRRKNRSYQDLSHGWGSNSQWRTSFRFDFEMEDSYLYNSEGKINLSMPQNSDLKFLKEHNINLQEAIEVTVNRHLITSLKDETEIFPYEFRFSENKKAKLY